MTVRYVKEARELGHPESIILPGDKKYDAGSALAAHRTVWKLARILKAQKAGTAIFRCRAAAIRCSGTEISDPDGVEEGGVIRGMGLLGYDDGIRVAWRGADHRVSGVILPGVAGSGRPCGSTFRMRPHEGYEIHMGQTIACAAVHSRLPEITDWIDGRDEAGVVHGRAT
ncbi:MAG: hypothetical protein ACLTSZ_17130 [Lachnospiraceae bacterium]